MYYNDKIDRNDWRSMDERSLVEAARDSGHELAIALGERLDDWFRIGLSAEKQLKTMEDRLALSGAAMQVMRAEMAALEGNG